MSSSPPPFKPIVSQILLGFGISLAVVGFGTLWMNHLLIRSNLDRQVKRRAESITRTLQLSSEGLIELGYISMLERVVTNYGALPDVTEVAIINPDGKTITHNLVTQINRPFAEIHPMLMDSVELASETGEVQSQHLRLNGRSVFVEILPFSNLMFGVDGRRGVAIAIIDLEPMQAEARRALIISSLIISSGILIILVILGILIHRIILAPLSKLNIALEASQNSGDFIFSPGKINNEITFVAKTFKEIFQQLASYEVLEKEIQQRKEVEIALRDSEAKERQKADELATAITKLQETQIQLIQTEKMSSLGQMVAGLAHEINNPVNYIHNNLLYAKQYLIDLLKLVHAYQQDFPDGTEKINQLLEETEFDFIEKDAEKLFKSVSHGSDRIRELVVSLQNFSRLDQSAKKLVKLHEGIDSTLLILKNRLERLDNSGLNGIKIIKNYNAIPAITCYASQLNQVFMNLLSNAIDALSKKNEAVITISTQSLEQDGVRITIEDNGSGIKQEIGDRLFDPFFTTKEVGQGTGLGLSISYKIIVEQHKGKLYYDSVIGKGTKFIIEIPYNVNNNP
ncbi:MAG: GHKL domain-containing protein [Limnothrix sp. RL_2_0]|nr:GHKL domain-containing protein [Limnothrix sp. RL_2_0]